MCSRWNPVIILLFTLKADPEISSISFDLFEELCKKKKIPVSSPICQAKPARMLYVYTKGTKTDATYEN